MNPVLAEIYSTVLPAAPFVIGAYVLIWLAILVYILVISSKVRRAEQQLMLLEETFAGQIRSSEDRE
jgi:CcmD family protein